MSLRVTFASSRPPISLATGTTRYDGGPAVSAGALWQIGSNTKAFTSVILLQLEAEGKLSITCSSRALMGSSSWTRGTTHSDLQATASSRASRVC